MKAKRIWITVLSVVFAVALCCVIFSAFKVKSVDVKYDVSEKKESAVRLLDEKLKSFGGANLVFFNTDKIKEIVSEDAFLECVSVEKRFPDTVVVSVKERLPLFNLAVGDKTYLISDEGVVLEENPETKDGVINLELVGISVSEIKVKEKIKADDKALFDIISAVKKNNVRGIVKSLKVEKNVLETDLTFETFTGVNVDVMKFTERGDEKTERVFGAYKNATDYEKSYYDLKVFEKDGGEIIVVWTRHGA